MGLESKILSGNARLGNAASGGPSIKPAPPPDDPEAVKRIQKALVELKFPLPLSFPAGPTNEPDGQFGQETYSQVIAFQQMVFPKDSSQWDGRVGRNTLGEMDSRLPKGSSPTPTPSSTVTVIPFHEASPLLISFEDHTRLSQNLEDTPVPLTRLNTNALLNVMINLRIFNTVAKREKQFMLELSLGGAVARVLALDFLANTLSGREIVYGASHLVSTAVHSSAEFTKAHSQVTAFIADALTRSALTGILDYHVLDVKTGNVPPPKLSFGTLTPLQIAFGSMQGVKIWLRDFEADGTTRDFKASLIYEWFDHFGADDNTITPDTRFHGTPGQVCLWIMQRQDPPARRPFVPKVVFADEARGKF
jgi:Putative peptidoglycan binding domain